MIVLLHLLASTRRETIEPLALNDDCTVALTSSTRRKIIETLKDNTQKYVVSLFAK